MTATVTVDEWTRPFRSVRGHLWILCPPASALMSPTPSPDISNVSVW